MIRKLLTLIDKSSMTFGEMAVKLDMSEADLKGRMEMMVRMGQLEAITMADLIGTLYEFGRRDADNRPPLTGMCSDGPTVVGYRMTEKGRRIVQAPENGRGGMSE